MRETGLRQVLAEPPWSCPADRSVNPFKLYRTGAKGFHHPVVGKLTLDFEMLDPWRAWRPEWSADAGPALGH